MLILLNLLGLCLGLFLVIGSGLVLVRMEFFGFFSTGLEAPLILAIVAGTFLILLAGVAIFGAFMACIGGNPVARCLATFLLTIYVVVMVTLILLELGATVALGLMRNQIVDTAGEWYRMEIEENVHQDNAEYIQNIDNLQRQLECCGFYGPDDYKNTTFGAQGKLPMSCCMSMNATSTTYNTTCYSNSTLLIETGCRIKLIRYVDDNVVPLSVAGGILVVSEVACVIIPIVLIIVMYVSARREGYEEA